MLYAYAGKYSLREAIIRCYRIVAHTTRALCLFANEKTDNFRLPLNQNLAKVRGQQHHLIDIRPCSLPRNDTNASSCQHSARP